MTSRFEKPLPQIIVDATPAEPAIEDAYMVVHSDIDISRGQKRLDNIMEKVTAPSNSKTADTLEFFNTWYQANQSTILAASTSIASLNINPKGVETAIATFGETAKVVMKGLDALGQVHPFIGVAVVAFKLVVSLDLTRRENNKKVIALKIQMQDTMSVLFQLRHMRDPQEVGPDGTTIKDRMQGLLMKIANDIKESGSACDHYMKKGVLAKTLKSKIYESRLAGYGDLFIKHREDLEFALSVHTSLGVDTANTKLDTQGDKLAAVDQKLDMLLLMRKLDTSREKDMLKFIDEKGGAKACVENDALLKELIQKSGEGVSGVIGSDRSRGTDGIAAAKKALTKELAENYDDALKKNFALFGRKLEVQTRQMQQELQVSIQEEGQHIITTILSGAHDRIVDEDLRAIWKDMRWKGSVKARHFVLALNDYFTEKFTAELIAVVNNGDANSPIPTPTSAVDPAWALMFKPKDDRWSLAYINITHLQAILEAVDDDGTGFISIKEVNTFATSRPEGWTLLHWLAYWSAGWHMSIDLYKNKIYKLVKTMLEWIEDVHPLNRKSMDEYFGHWNFNRIELILRSTEACSEEGDPDLIKLIKSYTATEEERLDLNLQTFNYQVDAQSTVALITGPGRVERYIYPLLYLLLKRHLTVIHLAKTHVLEPDEFVVMQQSLASVFEAVDARINNLESIFRQSHLDVKERLGNFAFGLLQLSYGDVEWEPSNSSYATWDVHDETMANEVETEIEELVQEASIDILVYPVDDTLTTAAYQFEDTFVPQPNLKLLEGPWAGNFYADSTEEEGVRYNSQGLFQLYIETVGDDGAITGKAQRFSGTFEVTGSISPSYELELLFTPKSGFATTCTGTLDPITGTLSGGYEYTNPDAQEIKLEDHDSDTGNQGDVEDGDEDDTPGQDGDDGQEAEAESEAQQPAGDGDDDQEAEADSEEQQPSEDGGTGLEQYGYGDMGEEELEKMFGLKNFVFSFCRTPASLFRFRYTPAQFASNAARARWSFACAAVLDQVQQKLWSWKRFESRSWERKRYLELDIRRQTDDKHLSPCEALTQAQLFELYGLRQALHPSDSQFYSYLASVEILRKPHFNGYSCDGCDREMVDGLLFCLTCMNDVYSDRIDLCLSCADVATDRDEFVHDSSHPLVKIGHTLHDNDLPWVVPEARIVCKRVKALFRSLTSLLNRIDPDLNDKIQPHDKLKTTDSETLCCCCGSAVSPPCWACVQCTPDAYICDECESNKVPALEDGPSTWHLVRHPLVRIRDDSEETEAPSTEARLATLEQRLADLDAKVDQRFSALETLLRQIVAGLPNGNSIQQS